MVAATESASSSEIEIPPYLEEQIKAGKTVLLLGAGASISAVDQNGQHAPSGIDLLNQLSDTFLGGKLKNRTLAQIAEYAISESSLFAVQEFIRERFEHLQPTYAHQLLPEFQWWGIATTNYDRLVEKAYEGAKPPTQQLITQIANGDLVDRDLRDPNSLNFLKLHGCITRTANADCPLILTVDQYIDHKVGRKRLFDRLTDWGYEHIFVFVGHSLQDPDIRQILKDLNRDCPSRNRFYCVVPDADPIEKRVFEQQKITVLSGTFDQFMRSLDLKITSQFRRLVIPAPSSSLPIASRFRNRSTLPSKELADFLSIDADFIASHTTNKPILPADFYKGLNPGFSGVDQQLDARRKIADEILTDVFLADESEHSNHAELVLIKAHAGAGKTVLLRRLAWDASRDYDCICIYIKSGGVLNARAIQELLELCQRRIFLFVDDVADKTRSVESLLKEVGSLGRLLTVIVAERINEWNVSCQSLNVSVTKVYELRYLTSLEIDDLLRLLQLHKAEGALHGRTVDEKRKEFEERSGRQLLVALHEATLGSSFRNIIENEYSNIYPEEAKQIYLTICVLNRLNVPVRAGIISRIHNVPFEEFKRRLFQPLEHIVQADYDIGIRDYAYKARHPDIAQMVFEVVLVKQEDRYARYIQCLKALNIDYSTDRVAFRQMTRAKAVLDLFSDHQLAKLIYEAAEEQVGKNDGPLIHQMALYELHRDNGNLERSSELLAMAVELRPYDFTVKHSFAELHLRLADKARTGLEMEKHLHAAAGFCQQYSGKANADAYGYVTMAKIGLKRLSVALDCTDPIGIEESVKDVERALQDGLQRFPDNSYLREAESQLAECLEDSERAVNALEKALQINPRSGFIASRLAQLYRKKTENEKARHVFQIAIAANTNDKRLHYSYARLLLDTDGDKQTILYHLQRSFMPGDTNYDAQLLYGRQLFIDGKTDDWKKVFRTLKSVASSPDVRFGLHYPLTERFQGEIVRIETTYCFISRDGLGDWIYAYRDNVTCNWMLLGKGQRVTFRIAFTFSGPSAFDVLIE